ncbi:MAG: gliding motility-associated protein GldE [Paludibacter sp.]|nr:gliding motility-associated protein GldE [Paludibacter sp.]MDD4198126.1 gliding motility-associated protein GldE [Paludibacter sp.]MDD4427378.1 gliding motility-associated protein GldE [Paludibacter sp.]
MYSFNVLLNVTFNSFTFNELFSLIISLVLLLISGLISASEVAFFSFSPQVLDQMEQSDKKTDKNILNLLHHPQKLLAAILIGNNFVNVAIILILTLVTNRLVNFEEAPVLGFVFQTIIITFLLLLFGEIIPKVYASQEGKKVATFTAPMLVILQKIFKPVIQILVKSTSTMNLRLAKRNKTNISIDELSHALELTSGNNDEDTEILEGIIKFGNIQVVDIMTSRVDIVDVDIKTSYKRLLEMIISSGYSRIPVYAGSHDNIKGILYSKDLLPHLDKPDSFRWQTLIRQAYYVPETKMIDDLLNEFQQNKVHLAIVVDEYGGTSGLVTLEDIIEEIVGDISDEYDEEETLYTKIDNHTFIFEAKIQLNDFFKIEEINEENFTKVTEEVETLAGLILELKGEIPAKNERIDFDKYVFEILSVDNRRIKKVKLYIKKDENEEDV